VGFAADPTATAGFHPEKFLQGVGKFYTYLNPPAAAHDKTHIKDVVEKMVRILLADWVRVLSHHSAPITFSGGKSCFASCLWH
jgi:hypothetical protein